MRRAMPSTGSWNRSWSHDDEGLTWADSADLGTSIDELDDAGFDATIPGAGWRCET